MGSPDGRPRLACLALLLSLAAPAHADPRGTNGHCTREDVESADPVATAFDRSSPDASAALIAEVVRPLPPAPAHVIESPPPRRAWTARLVDSFDVGARLKALSRLRILRLFDNARMTVFFGVDRSGHAGLHVQQQDPNDLPPLHVRRGAPFELTPLRAVPLGSM